MKSRAPNKTESKQIFAIRRINSAAKSRRKSSVRPKTSKNINGSVRNTIKGKTVTDSDINSKIDNLDTRLKFLEENVTNIASFIIDNQDTNKGTSNQIITSRFDNQLANNTLVTTPNSGISKYFRTAVEPPVQAQPQDYKKQLIGAVNDGNLEIVKFIIEKNPGSQNIRDAEEMSLPVIAYIKFIETKDPAYNHIITYLLSPKTGLDHEIRTEYMKFVKSYNKKYRNLGGKTQKHKSKKNAKKTSRR